jgi:flagellar biogenesis protein FliO
MERSGMQFMTALFGGTENTLLNSAFALGIVLVLIVLGLWALKVLTNATSKMGASRKRLVVVDKAQVDGKRQVVIIRRDDVEHVIMTGGPQDLVIESGIAVPQPVPPLRRAAQRPAAQPAAQPARADDIARPVAAERPVPREAVDRLHDLARPAPLKPHTSLRHTNLLRPVGTPETVIPIAPARLGDNSAGSAADSAPSSPDGQGSTPIGARTRFFRIRGRDQN